MPGQKLVIGNRCPGFYLEYNKWWTYTVITSMKQLEYNDYHTSEYLCQHFCLWTCPLFPPSAGHDTTVSLFTAVKDCNVTNHAVHLYDITKHNTWSVT